VTYGRTFPQLLGETNERGGGDRSGLSSSSDKKLKEKNETKTKRNST
jgi:hypothetical protein